MMTLGEKGKLLIRGSYGADGYQGVFNAVRDVDVLAGGNKDKVIVVYSRYGEMSKLTAYGLLNAGYKNVYDLGSIDVWPTEETWE